MGLSGHDGTGRYERQVDKISSEKQYFYGLNDDISGTSTYVHSDLVSLSADFVDDGSPVDKTYYRIINGTNGDERSWVIGLNNTWTKSGNPINGSERVISEPLVVGGIVFFTTYTPDEDICEGNGDAYLFAVDYRTGLAVSESVFDINADGIIDDNDVIVKGETIHRIGGIRIGKGQPSMPVLHKDTMCQYSPD